MHGLLAKSRSILLIFVIVSMASCNLPTAKTTQTEDAGGYIKTSAAETVTVLQTAGSFNTLPSRTPVPTQTLPGTIQPTGTISPTMPCDRAGFTADVTVPDGTKFQAGQSFTKTWRIKNTGSCSWNTSYAVIFINGDGMGSVPAVSMPGNVTPNQEINISVQMKAPDKPGSYIGNWKLRNSNGVIFGLADNSAFFVAIDVMGEEYNFAANYCDANWSNASDALPCPGGKENHQGFVIKLDQPKIETGDQTGDATIETHPQWINDGIITGKYPAIIVQTGQRFKAQIGCIYQATACSVKFKISYQVDGGSAQVLNEWTKAYDGKMIAVDEDLSSLAGKKTAFWLTVSTNGIPTQDWAIWVNPRISH